jgi:serine/threonine protein phosphatase PrpC
MEKKKKADELLSEVIKSLLITENQQEIIKQLCDLYYNAGGLDNLTKHKLDLINENK